MMLYYIIVKYIALHYISSRDPRWRGRGGVGRRLGWRRGRGGGVRVGCTYIDSDSDNDSDINVIIIIVIDNDYYYYCY